MSNKFFTRFNPPPSPSQFFDADKESSQSKTHSEFKSECDINEIVKRFKVTGFLIDPSKPATRRPVFGDFSDVPDPAAAARVFLEADAAWLSLPESERRKWPGGPREILDALSNGKRSDDLRALGFLPPLNSKPAAAGTPEPGDQPEGVGTSEAEK